MLRTARKEQRKTEDNSEDKPTVAQDLRGTSRSAKHEISRAGTNENRSGHLSAHSANTEYTLCQPYQANQLVSC